MSKTEKQSLIEGYQELMSDEASSFQSRKPKFKKLLYQLFELEGIDGSSKENFLVFDSRYFLIDIRWAENATNLDAIYTLEGFVNVKLSGTFGLIFSLSPYSKNVITRRANTVLLFDPSDLDYCFSEDYTFSEILKSKIKHASLVGKMLYRFEEHVKDNL